MFEIKYFLMNSVNLVNPVKKIKILDRIDRIILVNLIGHYFFLCVLGAFARGLKNQSHAETQSSQRVLMENLGINKLTKKI